jgi:alpha-glucosidase
VIQLRLRAGTHAPINEIYLRTAPDGEQAIKPMTPEGVEGVVRWWQVDLLISQPVIHYRFLILGECGAWWFTAAGPTDHDPLDHTDFRIVAEEKIPVWPREAIFYQIFPDRFANGDPSNDPTPQGFGPADAKPHTYPWGTSPPEGQPFSLVFYGGDLHGVAQRLDYLQSLGVTALYLNPIFKSYSNHKYDVVDYHNVDPHLGGDEALVELRRRLDARGMRYLLDIVPNHCGYWHPWFQKALADPTSPEAAFFTFNPHPHGYTSWLGVRSLPKLNYQSQELRQRIYGHSDSVFRRWLRPPFSADGWRVDVANMLARQGATQMGEEVARGIREAVKDIRQDAYLLGENFFDATPQLQGDQWDGVMNYLGFTFPLLHWLRGYHQKPFGQKDPIVSPTPWPTTSLVATWKQVLAAIPWSVALNQYNILDSHDTPRIRSILSEDDALHRLAVIILFTFPGVPGIYYGDEIGMSDHPNLGSRGCMIWDEARWNHGLLDFYRDLIALRRRARALQHGGFQVLAQETDTLTYQREWAEERFLVVAHRDSSPRQPGPIHVAHGGIPDGARFIEHFSGREVRVVDGAIPLPEQFRGATIWESVP